MREQRFYLLSEVSQILRRSTSSMRRMIRSGELRFVRIGRAIRIRAADLEQFLETRTSPSRSTRKSSPHSKTKGGRQP